ncbi:cobalt ECF transporter T component CbiQ [Pararhodospirillum photometricum]|nr:cobalt ECF transporter T component CbiQ [Pararhodospirillum photometricum]
MTDLFDRAAHASRWARRGVGGKTVLVGGLLGVALAAPAPWGALLVLPTALALALGPAGVSPRILLVLLGAPAGFLLLSAPVLAVSLDWTAGGFWPQVHLIPDGLGSALLLGVRALAGTACLALLALTTPLLDLIRLLARLGLPPALIDITVLTYRLVFLLGDSALTGVRAQSARLGHDGFHRSLRSLSWLGAGLLVRTMERARRLERGLAARGFDGALPPLARGPATRGADWSLAFGLPLALAAAALALEFGGPSVLAAVQGGFLP